MRIPARFAPILVENLERSRAVLATNGVPAVDEGHRLVIPAAYGAGMILTFVE